MSVPSLQDRLQDQPYQGYAYAYPHKTAYRHFESPIPLHQVWKDQDKSSLFLYVHIPFCEMRCGFCNLFTTTNPKENLVTRYLEAMELNLAAASEALGDHFRFARGAIGGGTPSFLTVEELNRLFESFSKHLGSFPLGMPLSCELSPATSDREKLEYLKAAGVTRFSIGVQSFIESETKTLGRPQKMEEVHKALSIIRECDPAVFNIDLIYGAEGQTIDSWKGSIREALQYSPEEIFLYPLYVRPLTGLEKIGRTPSDHRMDLYRAGRDLLFEEGYESVSMRLFRKKGMPVEDETLEGPLYCCQEDGMIGIGAGARSYTTQIHYCTEYAVGKTGISEIIDDYCGRSFSDHGHAVYGCRLTEEEQKRRFVMKSVLRSGGLSLSDYQSVYGSSPMVDFPELEDLVVEGLAHCGDDRLSLNDRGMERSDTIGPWLFSTETVSRMETYELV